MSRNRNVEIEDIDGTEETGKRPRRRGGRNRSRGGISASTVVILLILTAVIAGIIAYVAAYKKVEDEYAYSRQPIVIEEGEAMKTLKNNLEGGSSVTQALRLSFKDYLIIYTGKQYIFMPVNYNLKMHNRSSDKLKKISENEWEYRENGKTVSYKGIDVSVHQGDIDWTKVAEDKVEFAMIRAVYRGYGAEGNLVTDKKFVENIQGAQAAGIHTGVYMFSQALNAEEMDEEIKLLLETIKPYKIECPVVLDIELTQEGTGRADGLTMEERTALAKQFCEKIKAAGYIPMLYYNYETALLLLDTEQLEDYDKWYASYSSDFYYPYYYSLWQYTDKGSVSGIEGDVDMDMSFKKFW